MKRTLVLISLVLPLLGMARTYYPVTLSVTDEEFMTVIREVQRLSKAEILVLQPIRGKVSLNVRKALLPDVLDSLTSQVSARWAKGYLVTEEKTERKTRFEGPRVTLDIKEGTPFKDALKELEKAGGVPILVSPRIEAKVGPLRVKNLRLEQVLDRLCSMANVYWKEVYLIAKTEITLDLTSLFEGMDLSSLVGGEGQGGAGEGGRVIIEGLQYFGQLPLEDRVNIMSGLFDRLFSLPDDQRSQIIQRVADFLTNGVGWFLSLPPERQREVVGLVGPLFEAGVRAYFRLPPEQRRQLKPWEDALSPLEGYYLP